MFRMVLNQIKLNKHLKDFHFSEVNPRDGNASLKS